MIVLNPHILPQAKPYRAGFDSGRPRADRPAIGLAHPGGRLRDEGGRLGRHVGGRCSGAIARRVILVLLLAASPLQAAPAKPATSPANPAPTAQQIDALAQTILSTLQGNGGNGRVAEIQARLTFAIDQAQASCSTSQAAVAQVLGRAATLSRAARRALLSLRNALSRCPADGKGTGTAGQRSAESTLEKSPTLSLVGGSSNYPGRR